MFAAITCVLTMVVAVAGITPANAGSGTVKIDTIIPQNPNSPHQECGLFVKFFDFSPAGAMTANVTFTLQSGANAGQLITTTPASGPATNFAFTAGSGGGAIPDGAQVYYFDTSNLTPAPNGTYLVDVDTSVSNGVNSKQKIIRVSTCKPDLQIVKTGTSSVLPGGTVSYTLTVTNIGSVGVPKYSIADNVPTELTGVVVTPNTAGLLCTLSAGNVMDCDYDDVAKPLVPGDTASVTVTGTLDPAFPGTSISNTATVSPTDSTPSNNTSTKVTNVAQPVDVGIVKTALPATIDPGQNITYTLTVTNTGLTPVAPIPPATTTFVMDDTLAAGLTFVSATANSAGLTCNAAAPVHCEYTGTLAPGASVNATVVATVSATYAATTITNGASVTMTNDSVAANNTDAVTTNVNQSAALDIVKAKLGAPGAINPGDSFSYTLSVSNSGNLPATSFTVTDTLPTGVTLTGVPTGTGYSCPTAAAGDSSLSCTWSGSLAKGDPAAVLTVPVILDQTFAGTQIDNTGAVDGLASNTVSTAVNQVATLGIVKAGPAGPITPGATFSYTLTVSNSGNAAAPAFTVTDTLPTGVTTTALPTGANFTCAGPAVGATSVSCTHPAGLTKAGPAAVLTIPVRLSSTFAGNSITNTGQVNNTNSNPVTTGVSHPVAPGPLSASATAPTVSQSQCINGVASTPSYTVPTTTGVIYTPATGGPAVAGTTVTVTAAPAPGYVLTGPTSFDLVFAAAPNCSVDENLGVSKTGPGTAKPGDVLDYTVTVTNVKGTPATAFTVTDVLPTGLAFGSATGAGFTCGNVGQTVTCLYSGSLAVGQSASFVVQALIDPTFTGTSIANTAVVDPGRGDSDSADNSSTATTTIVPLPISGGNGGPALQPTDPPVPPTGGGGGGALPFTGADSLQVLRAGVTLLLVGLFLMLTMRRRRGTTE
jgi:uncharacterized repeat protein (TIGR01451 family)